LAETFVEGGADKKTSRPQALMFLNKPEVMKIPTGLQVIATLESTLHTVYMIVINCGAKSF
jgi:hypothetical protein